MGFAWRCGHIVAEEFTIITAYHSVPHQLSISFLLCNLETRPALASYFLFYCTLPFLNANCINLKPREEIFGLGERTGGKRGQRMERGHPWVQEVRLIYVKLEFCQSQIIRIWEYRSWSLLETPITVRFYSLELFPHPPRVDMKI